ncbi:unnamed protein product [Paramecium pentaurelia]|uniref:DNA-directed RNA polymerase n=1 Tax=Paramecium pentaurelia TaxID=43138 RepID=A0A8S1YAT9_9CILI|nr:unnamed protein product [Paramecium pentaurelia]
MYIKLNDKTITIFNIVTTRCYQFYRSQNIQGQELQYNNWGKNIENSPLDLGMGQSLRDTECSNCTLLNGCPRHFGYIPLQLPIYHLSFLLMLQSRQIYQYKQCQIVFKNTILQHIIKDFQEGSKEMLIKSIISQLPFVNRLGMQRNQPKVVQKIRILMHFMLGIQKQHYILFCINQFLNDQFDLLTLITPAPQAKCYVKQQKQIQDELTMNLKTILYHNDLQQKYAQEGKGWHTLRLPQFSSQDVKVDRRAIYQRLKGKRGRLRVSLSGKRAEFTACSIISPDLNLG